MKKKILEKKGKTFAELDKEIDKILIPLLQEPSFMQNEIKDLNSRVSVLERKAGINK